MNCCPHLDVEHILTAYRRYCTMCSCETKECVCSTPVGLSDICPMHGGNRLTAQEEPFFRQLDRMND